MNRLKRIIGIIASSIYTWLVLAATLAMILGFVQWFQPSLKILLAVCSAGALLVLLWPVIYIRSDEFRRRYNKIPDDIKLDVLKKQLHLCLPDFRKPALECLALAETIRNEFEGKLFQGEVAALLQNLYELALNHSELLERSKKFGTAQQQQAMNQLLKEQARSVEGALTALKKFSGNLTLFDLQVQDHKEIDRELKDINMGLQDAIREVQNG